MITLDLRKLRKRVIAPLTGVWRKEADFLYSTMDNYIEDAKRDNRQHLVDIWNEMRKDKQKHINMLREALEREAREEKFK
jgi:hypothetical protein